MKYGLQIKIGIGATFVLVVLAWLTYQYFVSVSNMSEAHSRTKYSIGVIQILENIQLLIKDCETAHREYLATADEKMLEPYYRKVYQLEVQLGKMRKKISSDSISNDQKQAFFELVPLIQKRLKMHKHIIHLKIHNKQSELFDSLYSDNSISTLKNITDKINLMHRRQESYLEIMKTEESKDLLYLMRLVPIMAGVMGILILGGAVVLIADVNERQNLQQNLRKTNEELQSTIEALDQSNKELLSLNASLESFSSAVSHDLKSPANQQLALVELLLAKEGNKLSGDGKLYIDKIKSSAHKMKTLISDLLQFSRLGKKEIQRTEVNLNDMVNQIIQSQQNLYHKKYNVHTAKLPVVKGDSGLLYQVWENLLSNAFKYSSKVDSPHIQIDYQEQNAQYVFAVKDNGDGFDMRKAGKLFKVFERMHRPDEFEGTGVGLSIVQKIIEKHGGAIWANAEPKKGAAFYFTLPKS